MKVCYNKKSNGAIAEAEVYLRVGFELKWGKKKWKNEVGKYDFFWEILKTT